MGWRPRAIARRGTRAGRRLVAALALVCGFGPAAPASPLMEGADATQPLDVLLERPGAALARAVAAIENGDRRLADALLGAIAEEHVVIADYAQLLRMRLRVSSGRHREAITMEKSWSDAESPARAEFYTLLGRAFLAEGDELRARSAWDYAAHATADGDRVASLYLSIGDSYQRSDLPRDAAEAFLRVWTRHPERTAAEPAEAALDQLEEQLGEPLRTASRYRKRADTLFARRHNESALAAYEQALAMGLPRKELREARERRADTLFRLRRYPEAAIAYADLPNRSNHRIQRARALARSGDVPGGARELERVGRAARNSSSARAQLLAGLLWEGEDEVSRAMRLYRSVILRAPDTGYAEAARWRLGWAAFREGRFEQAIEHFARLEQIERDPVAALRPRYWRIRAAERAGYPGIAERYAALAREFPLTYYGWRARERAPQDADAAEPSEIRPGRSALSPSALARPRILLEAGLYDDARAELDRLFKRARGLEDRLALAALYADAGNFHRAQRLMVDAYTERLARGPVPERLDLWWHAWPVPFAEEMRGATLEGLKISPELVYSIMREESGYRPKVLSVSGARGLLQLMPTTAERVARSSQLADFSADDLFVPRVNIQLGSDYLTQLLQRFAGRASAAIGSYNAGPHVVARWMRRADLEDDEWVEEIPYNQTRGYVKRVMRSLHAYQVLY